jgi:hypothetical protein
MIDIGLVVIGGILYLAGQYGAALLLIVLAIISGAGAALMAVANPDWYVEKRMNAGLDMDFINPNKHIVSLLITKAVVIAVLVWAAWHVAHKAGYL